MNENIVDCYGFSSDVIPSDNKHITILDIELDEHHKSVSDTDKIKQVDDIIEDVDMSFKCYFMFKSSRHGIHVINPVARPKDDVFQIKASIQYDDHSHCAIGYKRDSWVARISHKGRKHRPRPFKCKIDVESMLNSPKQYLISYPHLKLIHDLYKEFYDQVTHFIDRVDRAEDSKIKLVGKRLKVDKYATYERHMGQ